MEYRRKPEIVNAVQLFIDDDVTLYPDWVLKEIDSENLVFNDFNTDIGVLGHIKTDEGKFLVGFGSFIVKTQTGNLKLYDSETFNRLFERVD